MSQPEQTNQPSAEHSEGLQDSRRRLWASLTLLFGIGMSVLDSSMTNVALPAIAKDMDVSAAAVVWIVNAYGLTLVMTLLPLSAVGERTGFKRLFRYGLSLFICASVASSFAPSLPVLLVCRVLQGLGGSAIMCLFGALVRHIYPPKHMARGIGMNAMMVGLMSVIGPTIGTFILSISNWHWIFLINLPIGAIILLGVKYLPDVSPVKGRFDWNSAMLSMVTVGLLIVGIDYSSTYVWQSACLIVFGILTGIVLVRRSYQQPAPLVPVDLLQIPAMRFAIAASLCTFSAQMATFVSLPFYLQQEMSRPLSSVGMLMAGWPLGAALIAMVAGRLSNMFPVAALCGVGAGAMAIGLLVIVLAPASINDIWLMMAMVLGGVGFGFFQTPNNRVIIGSAPKHRAGALGGLQATTRVFGQTFGAAMVASAFSLSVSSGPTLGLSVGVTFASLAVLVNVIRHRQTDVSRTGG
ncbi:MFS transporter [Sheuella amnicola]|uniref:MFS transporter n=1 Tax=Sheuella amnicola TaxID=2707330 RepID=UPI0019459D45|nr:MFS transporter [Sheuella amnicola]